MKVPRKTVDLACRLGELDILHRWHWWTTRVPLPWLKWTYGLLKNLGTKLEDSLLLVWMIEIHEWDSDSERDVALHIQVTWCHSLTYPTHVSLSIAPKCLLRFTQWNIEMPWFEPSSPQRKTFAAKGGCDWPTKIKHDNIRELRLFVELKKRNVRSSMDITTSLATCHVVWPNSWVVVIGVSNLSWTCFSLARCNADPLTHPPGALGLLASYKLCGYGLMKQISPTSLPCIKLAFLAWGSTLLLGLSCHVLYGKDLHPTPTQTSGILWA